MIHRGWYYFYTLAVSGVLIFILIISSTYEIWDVIYGGE